jgi:phospholipase C
VSRLRLLAVAGLLGLVAVAAVPPARAAQDPGAAPSLGSGAHAPRTPIKHFITLMQENHSFDNYFGSYPGADGIPKGTCMPFDNKDPKGGCVRPFHLGNRAVTDLGHTREVFDAEYNGGRMDGFVSAYRRQGQGGQLAMGYYDDRDIPYYWNIADNYVLFDRFFTSSGAGSVWNHMFWVTGTPGNPDEDMIPPEGFGDLPTIFDRLEQAGVSWKFYVQNYDPTVNFRTIKIAEKGERASQVIWVPLLSYARYIDDPRLRSHIVDLDEYYQDLARGTLPAVSYIVPSGASEHPPGRIQAGERFVRGLLNALASSTSWKDSAFTWTYDDWGGWYDHVKPPRVDKYGYGFRAPALVVSAWAHRGKVDHTTLDFTSILKFIEENWNLRPLAARDAAANSLGVAFDFRAGPRPPEYISTVRIPSAPPEGRRPVIYTAYGLALALSVAIFAGARVSPLGATPIPAVATASATPTRPRPPPPRPAATPAPRPAGGNGAKPTTPPWRPLPAGAGLPARPWARRPRRPRLPPVGTRSRPAGFAAPERLDASLEELIRLLPRHLPARTARQLPDTAATRAARRARADAAMVMLDDGSGTLKISGSVGLPPGRSALEAGDGVELLLQQLHTDPVTVPLSILTPLPGGRRQPLLAVPLTHGDHAFGLIVAVRHPRPGDGHVPLFTGRDVQALTALAEELAEPLRTLFLLRRLRRVLEPGR